ncbi:MAG: PAS domain S-box protein [Proteobacteria bacterium]|nr:PAS domain S-box protein [Pseudomonadota bacterium]
MGKYIKDNVHMFFADDDTIRNHLYHHVTASEIFRILFRICDVMLFIVDENGSLCLANETALNHLGYNADEILGKSFLQIIDAKDRPIMESRMQSMSSEIHTIDTMSYLGKEKMCVSVDFRMMRDTIQDKTYFFIISKDISKLKATEEKFFKAFHSSSVIMVVFTVDEGRIIDANEAAFKMMGFSAHEMIGNTIVGLDLYPNKAQRKKIRDLIKTKGRIENYELTVKTRTGEICYVLFSMDALTIGHEACVLAVGSDFTQRKQTERDLKKAYKEQSRQKAIIEKKSRELEKAKRIIEKEARLVEESSRHKSEFLASMSHELRTPLNSIILLSDLLSQNRSGRLGEKEAEYASIIKSAGNDLLELINDILDISRVESGRMEINLSKVSMEYFCRKIRGYFTEMAGVKGLKFGIHPGAGLTDYFVTDVQKLEQIIKNLISNAIKFTEKGSVDLYIHRPEPTQDLTQIGINGMDHVRTLAFSVVDSGIGIKEDKKDYVFEFFRQADKSILRKYGGTGLGLPVSRVLAQLLGGDIQVESTYKKGSIFTLYIPEMTNEFQKIGSIKQHAETGFPESEGVFHDMSWSMAGKTIIIADDDMRTAYALIQNMDVYEPEIIVATDGKKCMEKLEEYPDTAILLLDIAMPMMDGLSVLRLIRKHKKFKKLPVIMITARAMDKDKDNCLSEGADAFLTKPLDMEKLLSTISRLLEK